MNNLFNKIKNSLFTPKNEIKSISEKAKQEMSESLKLADDFDLYSLDLSDLWEPDVSMDGDTMRFKEWVIQEDEVWKYIIIQWKKCREYMPWISWFVYKNAKDRYHYNAWLKVWFCDKWSFKKSITIEESGLPKPSAVIPSRDSKLLWWPFYDLSEKPNKHFEKKWNDSNPESNIFANITWDDIYSVSYKRTKENPSNIDSYQYVPWICWEDEKWKYLSINWIKFYKFKPWFSGYIYHEFVSEGSQSPCTLLAKYENGKMVWEGIVLQWAKNISQLIIKR